jgi:hypothetical protein
VISFTPAPSMVRTSSDAASDKKPMRLVDTRTVGDGVAILTYEPIREDGQGEQDDPEMVGSRAE